MCVHVCVCVCVCVWRGGGGHYGSIMYYDRRFLLKFQKLKREETEVKLRGRLKDMQGSCMQLQSSFVEQKADLFSKESDIQSLSAELHELHIQLQEVKTDMRAESDKKESLEEQLKQSQKLEEASSSILY